MASGQLGFTHAFLGDSAYGSAEVLGWLVYKHGIEPHVTISPPVRTAPYSREDFTYDRVGDVIFLPTSSVDDTNFQFSKMGAQVSPRKLLPKRQMASCVRAAGPSRRHLMSSGLPSKGGPVRLETVRLEIAQGKRETAVDAHQRGRAFDRPPLSGPGGM